MLASPFLEEDLRLSAGEGGVVSVHLSGTADSRWTGDARGGDLGSWPGTAAWTQGGVQRSKGQRDLAERPENVKNNVKK